MKRRTVAWMLALVLAIGTLAGCSGGKQEEAAQTEPTEQETEAEQKTEEAEAEAEEGPLPVDYFAGTELNIAVYKDPLDESESFEDKEIVKMAEEATGIHVNWTEIDKEVSSERVAAILSSGELPDVMLGLLTDADLSANRELFYDLSEEGLLEKYAPNVLEDYELGGQKVLEYLKHSDGSIRSLAGNMGTSVSSDASYVWMINQSWLDKLGKEMPTNADEFYDVLCAFRDNDMDGDGDATNEIPLSFQNVGGGYGFLHLANAYGIAGEDVKNYMYYYKMRDGQVSSNVDTDEFRAFLEWAHKLADEGLIDVEGFSQTSEQYTAKTAANRVGVYFAWDASTGVKSDPEQYVPMMPIQALEDVPAKKTGVEGIVGFNTASFAIGAESENVEAALHWWNYLSGDVETWAMCRYGCYYIDEETGLVRGGVDPAKKEEGVVYPHAYTLGLGNKTSPYGGPHEYPSLWTPGHVRLEISEKLKESGMLHVGIGDEIMIKRFVDADVQTERTLIEADLLPMIDRFIANSVVDGVTDESWEQFKSDLTAYRYYDWIDWWQKYADGSF